MMQRMIISFGKDEFILPKADVSLWGDEPNLLSRPRRSKTYLPTAFRRANETTWSQQVMFAVRVTEILQLVLLLK